MNGKTGIKRDDLAFAGIWAALTALSALLLFRFQTYASIDYDSSYQYFLTKHSWKEMFDLLLKDYSPPLYSIFIKAYSLLAGTGLVALRTSNIILTSYLFFVSLFPLRRLLGKKASVLATVMLLCSQYNIYFGHLIRPTYMGYVLTTAVFVYAALALFDRKTSDVITLAAAAILSMYTHNVSLTTAFCVYGILCIATLIKKDMALFKKFLISGIIVGILYIPWLTVTASQYNTVSNSFWNNRMSVAETMDCVYSVPFFHRGNVIIRLLITMFVLIATLISPLLALDRNRLHKASSFSDMGKAFKSASSLDIFKRTAFIALMQIISLLGFFLFSYHLQIQTPRYFYILAGGALIFIAGFVSLGDTKHILTAAFLLVMPFNMLSNYMHFDSYCNESEIERLYADISNASSGSEYYFYHCDEQGLGITSYLFPDSVHLTDDNTYTVLLTYDVFTTDIRQLRDGESILDESDEVFILTYYYLNIPLEEDEYELQEIGSYSLPYVGTESANTDMYLFKITRA